MSHTQARTSEFIRDAQQTFFDLMLNGYADRHRTPEETGFFPGDTSVRRFVWPLDGKPNKKDWFAIDQWVISPGRRGSFGNTILYHHGIPVWCMQYTGEYPDEVRRFLKGALFHTFSSKEWCGGRGPKEYGGTGRIYQNEWNGNFESFRGEEFIATKDGSFFEKCGGHIYAGGFL